MVVFCSCLFVWGVQYKERMFFFRHSDPVRIVESVLAACKTKDFMGMDEKFNPYYGVAVRAQKMPASVCFIYLFFIHSPRQ